jgi:hypothetical protein
MRDSGNVLGNQLCLLRNTAACDRLLAVDCDRKMTSLRLFIEHEKISQETPNF